MRAKTVTTKNHLYNPTNERKKKYLSGCCSQQECGHLRAAYQQRSDAADPEEFLKKINQTQMRKSK